MAVTVATSEGETFRIPRGRHRRARAQRNLARCRNGSNRRAKAKLRAARAYAREADRRRDWVEKVSTDIAQRYDTIRVEDLRIPSMVRTHRGLNREIHASAWGELVKRLQDKAPGRVEKVDPRHTSQQCSSCGHVARENRKSQADFLCVACGYIDNADLNAAKNIAARHAVTARGGPRSGPAKREPHEGDLVESAA